MLKNLFCLKNLFGAEKETKVRWSPRLLKIIHYRNDKEIGEIPPSQAPLAQADPAIVE